MKMMKDELLVSKGEAALLACKLLGQVPAGFIPDDEDADPVGPDDPDLAACAASYLTNGGGVRMKKPSDKKPVEAPTKKHAFGFTPGDPEFVPDEKPAAKPKATEAKTETKGGKK